jgi:hypothetical protein
MSDNIEFVPQKVRRHRSPVKRCVCGKSLAGGLYSKCNQCREQNCNHKGLTHYNSNCALICSGCGKMLKGIKADRVAQKRSFCEGGRLLNTEH